MQIEFGVFDHIDRGGRTFHDALDLRLRLVEWFDRNGFYAFHQAEHHSTPLSCAPSPNVLIAAMIQRTKRLRFAPLVYILTLYNPLRFIEEVCMLDHMSRGRVELGFGKGIAPFELMGWGINPLDAQDIYREALEAVRLGLTSQDKTLTMRGDFFRYVNVPLELETYTKPMPRLWYGLWKDPSSTVWPAENNCSVGLVLPSTECAPLVRKFSDEWQSHHGGSGKAFPKIGMTKTIIVADTDAEARRIAETAHQNYWQSMNSLWNRWHAQAGHFPRDFENVIDREMVVFGSPATVREQLAEQIERSGTNYMIGRFVYGDMEESVIMNSLEAFAGEVMPYFAAGALHQQAAE